MHALAEAWAARGRMLETRVGRVFVVDEPAEGEPDGPPVLLVHGFPTCSFDWRQAWPALRARRRVVAVDLPGYGLSAKPDRQHTIEAAADALLDVCRALDIGEVDMVTHDMGDTVGGALLARDLDGGVPLAVRRRVVTNGSIYIRMADFRWQQELLLRLPDAALPVAAPKWMYTRGIAGIFGATAPPDDELDALWDLFRHDGGARLVPRLIRYIQERRAHEHVWTTAIEEHPSPLAIVWGDRDPVALPAMAERLAEARDDAGLTWLHGTGHFPMTESPDAFAAAVLAGLGD